MDKVLVGLKANSISSAQFITVFLLIGSGFTVVDTETRDVEVVSILQLLSSLAIDPVAASIITTHHLQGVISNLDRSSLNRGPPGADLSPDMDMHAQLCGKLRVLDKNQVTATTDCKGLLYSTVSLEIVLLKRLCSLQLVYQVEGVQIAPLENPSMSTQLFGTLGPLHTSGQANDGRGSVSQDL
jgi:hypothetical protein